MKLWAEVFDPAGNLLGPGPIEAIQSVSVTYAMDEAGSWSMSVSGADWKSSQLLQQRRRIKVYADRAGVQRLLVHGIIENITQRSNPTGATKTINGPDIVGELAYKSTWLGWKRSAGVSEVVNDLLALAGNGWTITGGAPNPISARLDGTSVLKGLRAVLSQPGMHFRHLGDRLLEVGYLGSEASVRLVGPAPTRLLESPQVAAIEQITKQEDSEELYNVVVPIGGGKGEASLTLEKSFRTSPYPIVPFPGPDGRTLYALEHAESIAQYGRIEKVGTIKEIGPLSNSALDQQLAADALYDAASVALTRHAYPYEGYSVSIRGLQQTLRPGDKVQVIYNGDIVDRYGQVIDERSIEGEFWVLEVREAWDSESGQAVGLRIANTDRWPMDVEEIVLGSLESIRVESLQPQPYYSKDGNTVLRDLDPTNAARYPIHLTGATIAVTRCIFRMVTNPFRANIKGAASGGGTVTTTTDAGGTVTSTTADGAHNHVVAANTGGGSPWVGMTSKGYLFGGSPSSINANLATGATGNLLTFDTATPHSHSITLDPHSHSLTLEPHTHDVIWGVYNDIQYPAGIEILVDGVNRTSELGGPWAPGGGPLDIELQLANYLLPPLQRLHTIELRCSSGQGSVECNIELYEVIQSIQV